VEAWSRTILQRRHEVETHALAGTHLRQAVAKSRVVRQIDRCEGLGPQLQNDLPVRGFSFYDSHVEGLPYISFVKSRAMGKWAG
jgi:hypothetical protein